MEPRAPFGANPPRKIWSSVHARGSGRPFPPPKVTDAAPRERPSNRGIARGRRPVNAVTGHVCTPGKWPISIKRSTWVPVLETGRYRRSTMIGSRSRQSIGPAVRPMRGPATIRRKRGRSSSMKPPTPPANRWPVQSSPNKETNVVPIMRMRNAMGVSGKTSKRLMRPCQPRKSENSHSRHTGMPVGLPRPRRRQIEATRAKGPNASSGQSTSWSRQDQSQPTAEVSMSFMFFMPYRRARGWAFAYSAIIFAVSTSV